MATRICIVNQKGGVAKTTTAANIAALLAHGGKRVLAIDLDQQGSLGKVLGLAGPADGRTVYEVVKGECDVRDAIVKTQSGVDLIPADTMLAGAEIEFSTMVGREYRLADAISRVDADYDYCVLDCPPSLGTVVLMALTAADDVIVPLTASELALRGCAQLKETIRSVRDYTNADLRVAGIVLCKWNPRLRMSQEVREVAREAAAMLGGRVFEQPVRDAPAEDARAVAAGIPIVCSEPTSKLASDYRALLPEVVATIGGGPNGR